eukprot:Awhi_evm1s10077
MYSFKVSTFQKNDVFSASNRRSFNFETKQRRFSFETTFFRLRNDVLSTSNRRSFNFETTTIQIRNVDYSTHHIKMVTMATTMNCAPKWKVVNERLKEGENCTHVKRSLTPFVHPVNHFTLDDDEWSSSEDEE